MSDEKRVAYPVKKIENSILKTYRSRLWAPFINAVKQYELIQEGDRIAVCISGGKDSMLMAKLMQMLCRYSDFPFSVEYLVMDPGYNKENRRKIEDNARLLGIPITVFETNVFEVANMQLKYPCYLCAKMRRGYLYRNAKDLGCNKIALGHHLNDVIETVLMGMFYSSQIQTMPPKLHSRNFEKMELIRPLYCIREDDIIAWRNYNGLDFLQCACSYTERNENGENESKRKEIKELIRTLRRTNPDIEESLFNSVHNVSITTFPCYRLSDGKHSFLEKY
ncbi:MAG: hypothetical protein IJ831_00870 [Spirochaetales bacterium]|nr:hypothetical protein [Spirochaetales bacterium]